MGLVRAIRAVALAAGAFMGAAELAAQTAPTPILPPLVTTAATSTLDRTGRPWVYVMFGENRPGLLLSRTLALYAKTGPPQSAEPFTFRGLVTHTNDPTALQVILQRAASLGEDLAILEVGLTDLHRLLINTVDTDNPPVTGPPVMPLNQRLSALLRRAEGSVSLGQMLDMIGVAHPAVRLARGTAWAGPLAVAAGTEVTIEVRERNGVGEDEAVIGRVTVRAGQADPLPAPGPVVEVPDLTASGDLNVKLRWATSPELRREVSAGVLLWRVGKALAEAQGFHAAPPTAAALAALAAAQPAEAQQVSPGPVFASKLFSAADVANFDPAADGDPTTHFCADDNDRTLPGGSALPEGTRVYYFAAAADLLGRPGLVSAGVQAVFCRRLPPPLPARFAVRNAWTPEAGQYFDVSWLQNAVGGEVPTTRYEVFRGDDLAHHAKALNGELELAADRIDPAQPTAIQRIGSVAEPGLDPPGTLTLADTGVAATEANFGKTWWFAIRAVHAGPPGCGETVSTLSPPTFAALRQRQGPEAPDPSQQFETDNDCSRSLRVACITSAAATDELAGEPLDPSVAHYRAYCQRRHSAIVAVDLRVIDIDDNPSTEVMAEVRVVFPEDNEAVELPFTRPLIAADRRIEVQCRAVAYDGSLSRWAAGHLGSRAPGVRTPGHFVRHRFLAGAIVESERLSHPDDELWRSLGDPLPGECGDGRALLTVSPDSGRILPIRITLRLTARTAEYRVYRRIDAGELSLLAQGLVDNLAPGAAVERFDDAPPVTACTVSYYAQYLDENGNASPLALLWTRRILGPAPPAPLLTTPTPADMGGTDAAPLVTLSWVCPPQAVERFEVFVHTVTVRPPGTPPPVNSPDRLFLREVAVKSVFSPLSKFTAVDRALDGYVVLLDRSFLTGKVGGDFGAGPRFTLPLEVSKDLEYTVWVRGLGPNGEIGKDSRRVTLRWQPPRVAAGSIPWPARPLPPVGSFHPGMAAFDLRDLLFMVPAELQAGINVDETPVGVQVGVIQPIDSGEFNPFPHPPRHGRLVFEPRWDGVTYGKHDPNSQLFTHATDATQHLLPCVLYRQQVANTSFPNVSGDVIQCSPLIGKIAWTRPVSADGQPSNGAAELVDPFFRWFPCIWNGNAEIGDTRLLSLFLVDTQPVVGGARYRYWLMRFDERGEPVQAIPCGEVTIREPAP